MGERVMIIGGSGVGKSSSYENFKDSEVGIFNVAGKRPPFRKKLAMVNRPSYQQIKDTLAANNLHAYIIDDSTYLMQFAMFEHAREKGFEKFTSMALDFEQLLQAASGTDEDTIVYFLHHPQFGEDGKAKPQTVGKMLDNQLNIEGLFPIVLECAVRDGEHVFVTKNDGFNVAKAPRGMFDADIIPNDLKAVDTAIREYWGMRPLSSTSKAGGTK
ncbi:MAG: hypothetical protein IJ113_01150 [Eggerthellaceae bacterium]|nr:hypothetical protein [Eggerthellaceae bacterium]